MLAISLVLSVSSCVKKDVNSEAQLEANSQWAKGESGIHIAMAETEKGRAEQKYWVYAYTKNLKLENGFFCLSGISECEKANNRPLLELKPSKDDKGQEGFVSDRRIPLRENFVLTVIAQHVDGGQRKFVSQSFVALKPNEEHIFEFKATTNRDLKNPEELVSAFRNSKFEQRQTTNQVWEVQPTNRATNVTYSYIPHGFINQLNATRAQRGLRGVVHDANLDAWAQMNNYDQNARGLGHHKNPGGVQNAAMGHVASIFNMWMNSPAHRANMLSPNITRVGIACMGSYCTMNGM
jgi:hypothetical protein